MAFGGGSPHFGLFPADKKHPVDKYHPLRYPAACCGVLHWNPRRNSFYLPNLGLKSAMGIIVLRIEEIEGRVWSGSSMEAITPEYSPAIPCAGWVGAIYVRLEPQSVEHALGLLPFFDQPRPEFGSCHRVSRNVV
jgi:hypothetical protein